MVTPSDVSTDTQIIEPDTGYHTLDRVDRKGAKEDYIVKMNDLSVGLNQRGSLMLNIPNGRTVLCQTNFAQDFLRELGGAGFVNYARLLRTDGQFDLLLRNIHERLDLIDGKKMIRTIENSKRPYFEARALLSTRYKRMDNDVLFPLIDNILKQLSSIAGRFSTAHEVKFLGGRNDGSTTHARFVSRQPIYQNGDRKMYFGFQVRNSETRNSAIYIEFFICDDFCENGCVFGKKELDMEPLYMKHSGREIKGTGLCPARRLSFEDSRKIQNYIFKMFNHNTVDKMHDLLKTSFDREFVSGEDLIIERLGKRHKLSEAEIEIVKEEFIGGERHAYGIQAAFTAAAQKVETFERRADLDRIGGEILEQNDQQWENLVALTA